MYLTTLYFGFFPIYAFPGIQERVTMRLIPPTKLREGNVFSGVNLSVSLFTGGPTIQGAVPSIRARLTRTSVYSPPPPDMFRLVPLGPYCLDQPDPSPGHIQTCTNLDLPVQGTHAPTPPPEMFKLVHYKAHTVGKQTVGILLEYFLVVF